MSIIRVSVLTEKSQVDRAVFCGRHELSSARQVVIHNEVVATEFPCIVH